jgi:hypothetical protein
MGILPGAPSSLPKLRATLFLVCLLWVCPAAGQPAPDTEPDANPLAVLNDQVRRTLADAGVPMSPDQERAIALMMEERLRASEELFGDLLDFRSGPTQGQEQDRLRSAIDWMRTEFLRNLTGYLTEPQKLAWDAYLERQAAAGTNVPAAAQLSQQTQYVRINNNAFTAENNGFDSGSSTDVVQRGGAGAWHGNTQFLFKDDALNARNAFAGNKPPYQERRLSVDVSGPSIPGRLSSGIAFQQSESENVGTIRATLPEGIFALGITRPNVFRSIQLRNTYQAADAHSIRTFVRRESETSKDQGIGGFSLPERRWDGHRSQWNVGVFPFSALSATSIHEARFELNTSRNESIPFSEAIRINVLDAFSGGGAQNRSDESNRRVGFGNMYTRLGDRITLKTGFSGNYRTRRTVSTENFGGTFTFSNLDAYLSASPLTYRVTRGAPDLEVRQLEGAGFLQTDVSVSSQLTLMFGARYEAQQNVNDYNNLDPRVGFAYAPGSATVIRGGGGIFHRRLEIWLIENQRRLDGTRQFEIVIDNPSYPDPFAAGTRRETFPSVRVTDPGLALPYSSIAMLSLERTFFSNLLLTATYDFQREYHRLRLRNLNAPFDSRFQVRRSCTAETPAEACVKPDPRRGNVIALEAAGKDVRHGLRLSVRKRFSIFNGQLSYQGQRVYGDVQGGDIALISDAYNPSADWGRAPMPTHQINGTLNASLPLGVFVSGAMTFRSGRYYTVTTGTDDNRDSSVNDRPAGVAPNTELGPQYLNVDFNVSKAFFFGSGGSASSTNVNVFANMTNAFNHVHYGTPSGVMTSPNFRRITSASDPREIEVGVRFQF